MLGCFFFESCAQHFYLQRGFHFTTLILNSGRRFWFRIYPSLQGKLGTSWPLFKSCFCSYTNCYSKMGGGSGQVLLKFQQKVFPISSSAVLTGEFYSPPPLLVCGRHLVTGFVPAEHSCKFYLTLQLWTSVPRGVCYSLSHDHRGSFRPKCPTSRAAGQLSRSSTAPTNKVWFNLDSLLLKPGQKKQRLHSRDCFGSADLQTREEAPEKLFATCLRAEAGGDPSADPLLPPGAGFPDPCGKPPLRGRWGATGGVREAGPGRTALLPAPYSASSGGMPSSSSVQAAGSGYGKWPCSHIARRCHDTAAPPPNPSPFLNSLLIPAAAAAHPPAPCRSCATCATGSRTTSARSAARCAPPAPASAPGTAGTAARCAPRRPHCNERLAHGPGPTGPAHPIPSQPRSPLTAAARARCRARSRCPRPAAAAPRSAPATPTWRPRSPQGHRTAPQRRPAPTHRREGGTGGISCSSGLALGTEGKEKAAKPPPLFKCSL